VNRGKLTADDQTEALAQLSVVTDLDSFSDRQLVVEAVTEDEELKKDVFRRLDAVVSDPEAILASNTSSIPVTRLAAATSRPCQVVGLHFFNPVPVMALVELVTTVLSSDTAGDRAEAYARDTLGKTVIRTTDRGGVVVNMLLVPFLPGRSGWTRRGSPRPRTSTPACDSAPTIRWARSS
jgi:3-hydroxybutyryl-CoA dehydrogenase